MEFSALRGNANSKLIKGIIALVVVFFLIIALSSSNSGQRRRGFDEDIFDPSTFEVPEVPAASYKRDPKDPYLQAEMDCENNCNGPSHGRCFFGQCFCKDGFSGPSCGTGSRRVCNDEMSLRCYHYPTAGTPEVSLAMWKRALSAESQHWEGTKNKQDRPQEHVYGFNAYRTLPKNLGRLIEVGSGPFSQTQFILRTRKDIAVESITLMEPNALNYAKNVPHCSYRDGTFLGTNIPLTVVAAGGEVPLFVEQFDTVVLMNVIEHVQSAFEIMENMYRMLKPGGIMVFHERWWDYLFPDVLDSQDHDNVLHPVRVKKAMYYAFLSHFETLYMDDDGTPHLEERNEQGFYFIGVKRSSFTIPPKKLTPIVPRLGTQSDEKKP